MKFQDEGPKLRQHFEKAAQTEGEDDIFKPEQPWRDATSSISSGASSSSPSDTESNDATALQVAIRERASMFTMSENSELAILDKGRRAQLLHNHSAPPLLERDFTLMEENAVKYFDLDPFGWVPSPSLQQQQLLHTFTSSFSATSTVEISPVFRSHGNWLSYLPQFSGSNALLDNAVRACTLAHLGRLCDSEHVMHEAQAHYGRALRLLSSALQDANKGMSSETLSATMLLSFYEMFASDSDQSWVRHAGGASTLMKMRGAARHRTGFDREMFIAYRHALIIQAFEAQTPCFLNEPEWRQLCRQIYEDMCASGLVKDKLDLFAALDTFLQEMAQLPELAYEARNITQVARTTNSDSKTIAKNLSARAAKNRANLKSAHMRFRAALKRLGHEPSSRTSSDWVFPVRYDYKNIFSGGMFTGYWTVLIFVNVLLKELDPSPERIAMCSVENSEAAREICRSAAWMSTSSFLGPFLLTFALRVSLLALEDQTQRTWVLAVLRNLGATRLSMAKAIPYPNAHPDRGLPQVREAVQGTGIHEV